MGIRGEGENEIEIEVEIENKNEIVQSLPLLPGWRKRSRPMVLRWHCRSDIKIFFLILSAPALFSRKARRGAMHAKEFRYAELV
jgi:hypothetical protein